MVNNNNDMLDILKYGNSLYLADAPNLNFKRDWCARRNGVQPGTLQFLGGTQGTDTDPRERIKPEYSHSTQDDPWASIKSCVTLEGIAMLQLQDIKSNLAVSLDGATTAMEEQKMDNEGGVNLLLKCPPTHKE